MYSKKTIESANQFAAGYETYIAEKNWVGPDILFENMKLLVKPGAYMLDLGIGTGLASRPFKDFGLFLDGIDGSEEMIKICHIKQLAENLVCMDLASSNLDFGLNRYDLVISNALLHMIFDLKPIFTSTYKTLIDNGYFAFTVILYNSLIDLDFSPSEIPGIYNKTNSDSDILNFRHTDVYIKELANQSGFSLLNRIDFVGFIDPVEKIEIVFSIYITKKTIIRNE